MDKRIVLEDLRDRLQQINDELDWLYLRIKKYEEKAIHLKELIAEIESLK